MCSDGFLKCVRFEDVNKNPDLVDLNVLSDVRSDLVEVCTLLCIFTVVFCTFEGSNLRFSYAIEAQ